MNTKILLGSIGAVIILILVSFTNVVGVQSIISGPVNDSPLFSIRTQKKINQESNTILTSNYLGKGLNILPFPKRDNRTTLIQRVIERIGRMDDKQFNRFQSLILSRFYEEKNDINIDATQLVTILKQLKSNTKVLNIILNNDGNDPKNDPPTLTSVWCPCLTYDMVPHCLLFLILVGILILPLWPLFRLLTLDIACPPETFECS